MSKRIKMVLYGEPGTGKSVFACKAPKPYFICSDGNYEWLELFGADPNAHIDLSTFTEFKNLIAKKDAFKDYETVVVDLAEDFFKFCEYEYCLRQRIEDVSDVGYGKAYNITRNEYFITICKLLSMDKNVILIMHGSTTTEKDRHGIEHVKYAPSSRMPEKLVDMIEGRVRYFLRCYTKDEELDGNKIIKKRYLSLIPKPNEFGIIRGIDEYTVPQDIPLDWDEFISTIGFKFEPNQEEINKQAEIFDQEDINKKIEEVSVPPWEEDTPTEKLEKTEEIKQEKVEETKQEKAEKKVLSNEDKLAAIRAKLAEVNKEK